jgi:hypothetical protein
MALPVLLADRLREAPQGSLPRAGFLIEHL